MVGHVFDTGYVVYDPDKDSYFTSNTGIFKTKLNAEKQCASWNRVFKTSCTVVKVNIVAVDE